MEIDALTIATFLAVIVALFQQKFWEWLNKPKIKFGLSNFPPHAISVIGKQSNILQYYRFKIINEGKTIAKNCQVKLVSVISTRKKSIFSLIEPDKLKWSSAPVDNRFSIHREKIDISPSGGWEFCDLLKIDSHLLTTIQFMSLGNRTIEIADEYIITIEISGDNFDPKTAQIKLSQNPNANLLIGDWNWMSLNWFRNTSQSPSDYTQEPSTKPQHLEQPHSENEDNSDSSS